MSKVVYKFELRMGDTNLELPEGYEVVSAVMQNNRPVVYCLVDKEATVKDIAIFEVVMTGQELVNAGRHEFIDTIYNDDKSFVLHVFERKSAF